MKTTRWEQRLENFKKALNQLLRFLQKSDLSELEEQGLIKAFEYTYELAWNTLKDFYEYEGTQGIQGSRDAITIAYQRGLIQDGEAWMGMVTSRIKTVHTHDEIMAKEITQLIRANYAVLFQKLVVNFEHQIEKVNKL